MFDDEALVYFFNTIYGWMDTYYALAMHNMPGMASPIAPWLEKAGAFKAGGFGIMAAFFVAIVAVLGAIWIWRNWTLRIWKTGPNC